MNVKGITVKELKALQDSKEDYQLIDVREKHEFDFVNLDGLLIPQGDILKHVDKIATDKKVVVHCRSGARSANVISALQQYHQLENLYNLTGGILAWSREIDSSLPQY